MNSPKKSEILFVESEILFASPPLGIG